VIYVVRFLLCTLYTLVLGSAALLLTLVEGNGEPVVRLARIWVRWCLRTCGVSVEAEGLENVAPDGQPSIIMSNHQSVFDTAALIATLPISWRFVAKRELTRIPVFGWALVVGGHVIVDRGNREKAVASLRRAAERVRGGTNVIVFPEGTRSASGTLGEFKSGGFHLAIESGVPVVPATVSGSCRITPKRSLRIESGRILIRYGRPIPTEKLSIDDRAWLKEQVREAILAGFDPELQSAPGGDPPATPRAS
jgi:1-acyl-sn-glycerol-3-phosphate acyltransferase